MKASTAAILICLCGPAAATTCTPASLEEPSRAAVVRTSAGAAPPAPRNTPEPQPQPQRQPETPAQQRQMLLAGVILMLAIALRHHGSGSR